MVLRSNRSLPIFLFFFFWCSGVTIAFDQGMSLLIGDSFEVSLCDGDGRREHSRISHFCNPPPSSKEYFTVIPNYTYDTSSSTLRYIDSNETQ